MNEHIVVNIIDSVRELLILTAAGILVYKLEYLRNLKKVCKIKKCSKQEAELELVKHQSLGIVEEIDKFQKEEKEHA